MSAAQRLALVDRADPALSVAAQCRLLKVARSTLYYQSAPVDPDDLALMRRMDELYPAFLTRVLKVALLHSIAVPHRADVADGVRSAGF